MKTTIWLKNGKILKQVDNNLNVIPELENKIYNMDFDSDHGTIFLEEFADKFHFDYKLYNVCSDDINYIVNTYENTTGNLGVLFSGLKGTGKTVSAKVLANKLGLPVILVNSPYPGIDSFIGKIQCECILLFDEFEKNFSDDDCKDEILLSVMDSVYSNDYRKVFILTTNTTQINSNFLSRPSRIRYVKKFGNLSPEIILEYLKDNLKYPEYTQDIIEFVDSLELSTIDILKVVVEDVNIHNISPTKLKNLLNITLPVFRYSFSFMWCDKLSDANEATFEHNESLIDTPKPDGGTYEAKDFRIHYGCHLNSRQHILDYQVGDTFGNFGTIIKPISNKGYVVTLDDDDYYLIRVENLDLRPSLYNGLLCV